jgi:hypothetical protein
MEEQEEKLQLKAKRWINTKVVFEWNGSKYIEKIVEGYWYDGALAFADEVENAGHGGGGGGGAGGNGGAVVLIISNLAAALIDSGKIIVEVTGGNGGTRGLANGAVSGGNSSNHGIAGTTGSAGSNLTQVV